MFGYVVINKPELKFKEYDVYHAYYCGLCRTLKNQYGYKGQISLNYDLTFIAMILTQLYEVQTKEEISRCVMHPLHKYLKYDNDCIDYAAKMTIVLTYLKCEDDWLDEKKITRQVYKKMLSKHYQQIKKEYPEAISKIERALECIHNYENENCYQLDDVAKCFGEVMGLICSSYRDDVWQDDLYEMGFYLGKFIYFMDAYDDIEEDLKKGRYNPFKELYQQDSFEEKSYMILEMMISRATNAFECLPIIENVEIMRNILYSGVWTKYEFKKKKMEEKK